MINGYLTLISQKVESQTLVEDSQCGNTFLIYQNGFLVICRALLNSSLTPSTSKILLLRQDAPLNFDLLLSALCLGRGGGGMPRPQTQ